MPVGFVDAACLAYLGYTDDLSDKVSADDFKIGLAGVPNVSGNNWSLDWLPGGADGNFSYAVKLDSSTNRAGSYALAFRGTNPDRATFDFWVDLLEDADLKLVAADEPLSDFTVTQGLKFAFAASLNQGGAKVSGASMTLEQYIGQLPTGADLLVTGHSFGGSLAVLATLLIKHQVPSLNLQTCTFAAPTAWDASVADWFSSNGMSYYAAINTNDIVTMAYQNIKQVLATYQPNGPSLDCEWYHPLVGIMALLASREGMYSPIRSSQNNSTIFTSTLEGATWGDAAKLCHSMRDSYFRPVTGHDASDIPIQNSFSSNLSNRA